MDKYLGCLLGLACGDALGTTVEFRPPGSFQPVFDITGGGPFRLQPGQWTDDTSMALCLADSLISCDGFDAKDQMERYVRWWKKGYLSSTGSCFDIGNTVRESLERFIQSGDPCSGSTSSLSQGNGSLMRLAPVPMFFASNIVEAIEMSGQSSRTTHGASGCIDACRYFGGLMVGALGGVDKKTLLSERFCPIENYWEQNLLDPGIDTIARGSFKNKQPPEIRGTGFVLASMEAALWAFYTTCTFEEGCVRAVNLGDDADTTGAIYGQLAGAFYGKSGIPQHWLERIYRIDLIEQFAEKLFKNSEG
ncbi:MAG: ADP-ribosylglycohydrolase family protein [Candidatus Obscuribacterales bacterium]|nr:ADP-ribosylglycohydrolase family protein [Candidatus Obscuribacterales bacterium]